MTLAEVIDEHFLARYRALLDAEDAAFDELEHAYEDGDREHWEDDLLAWQNAIERRIAYLSRCRVDLTTTDGMRPRLTLRV
ncbi:MAG TPA: hypothetical protein VGI06_17890 [Acidimicrobiales bacterium]|jgi:hypothetical protein